VRFAYAFAAALAAVSFSAGAADSAKVLRTAFQIAESSFDPVLAWDAASNSVVEHISESMLEYEYLARPVKLAPLTLERMPEVSNNGATYLCRVRKGIFFAADPAFKGKPRELTAGDYAYSMKRLLDPALKENRQARLRRPSRGARNRRSLHAAHSSQAARLYVSLRAGDARNSCRGA